MTTPRKLARQRAARQRQQENIQNLQQGAQEAAQNPTAPSANPDDPLGLVKGGSAAVRVISSPGVKATKKPGKGGATVVDSRGTSRRPSATVNVVHGQSQARRSVRVQAQPGTNVYGNARVVPSNIPQQPQQVPQQQVVQQPQMQQPAMHPQMKPQPQQMPGFHTQMTQQQVQQAVSPPVPNAPAQQPQSAAATRPQADLTVILMCFERPGIYRRQLEALRSQSFPPSVIMTIDSPGTVPHDERSLSGSGSVVLRSNHDMGPWMRFNLALEAPTTYVCILDDDTIPGPKWVEACMKRMAQAEALRSDDEDDPGTVCIAAAGDIFRSDDPADCYRVGPESPRPEELEVDIGRQAWFFRKDMIQEFVAYPRYTDPRTGWGLHFAAALQEAGVLTVVLPYETGNSAAWGMIQPASQDRSVTSRLNALAAQGGPTAEHVRATAYRAYRQAGWVPGVLEGDLDVDDEQDDGEASDEPAQEDEQAQG